MLDEEMDDIIRNAAAKHHPAYNNKAWEMMERKLDKHLPQKKDPGRFIFFLLLFLLLGSGAILTAIYFSGNNNSVNTGVTEKNIGDKQLAAEPVSQKTKTANHPVENTSPQNINAAEQTEALSPNNPINTNSRLGGANDNINTKGSGNNKRSTVVNKPKTGTGITTPDASVADESQKAASQKRENKTPLQRKTEGKTDVVITTATPENMEAENIETTHVNIDKEKAITEGQKKGSVKVNEDTKKKEEPITKNKTSYAPDKKKSDRRFVSNFGLTFSAGPDLSFIQLDKPGNVTMTYGAGFSYSFAKRFTARAGFYVAKKIYTATPDQYHAPGGITYPYLTSVDANCRVYEIPISLSYSFGQSKNHSWFGGVGLSSFLMKNESYYYNYKRPSGQTYYYEKTVTNENNHYFAVLTLSGGYQYQINKRFSVQGEPYVKLPLSGIGLGKINLNSAGLLFTVTVKPFAKRK